MDIIVMYNVPIMLCFKNRYVTVRLHISLLMEGVARSVILMCSQSGIFYKLSLTVQKNQKLYHTSWLKSRHTKHLATPYLR